MAEILRLLLAAILWIAIAYFDFSFVAAHLWPSQTEDMFLAPFEPLVIANLTFLMMYVTLREK